MMKAPKSPTDRIAARLAALVTGRPWTVMVIAVLVAIAAGSGVRHLDFTNNYRAFFSPDNPDLLAFERFQATYTKNDNILFAIQPRDGDVFEPSTAAALEWLTAQAWSIPYAIRVDSVTNFQHSWANGDDLTVEDLVRDAGSMSIDQLAERRRIALAEPLLIGNLISPDARTTGINVTLQYPEETIGEVPEAMAVARDLAEQFRLRLPGATVALTGMTPLNNAFAESGQNDALSLIPAMFGVLVLLMALVLRSTWGTIGTLSIIGLSSATALGATGYAGVTLDPIALTAPVIIMTLGVADCIHILITVLQQLRGGADRARAIGEALRLNLVPVAITSVTTMIGFLALNFSDSPPFWYLGNITAVGIGAALLFAVTFFPAFLSVAPLRVRQAAGSRSSLDRFLSRLADLVVRRHRAVLVTVGVAMLALAAMFPANDLNDEFVKYFDHRIDFRNHAEWAMENLTGVYLIEFSLEAGEAEGVNDPAYLEALGRFSSWLREQPEVRHVTSYADIARRLNMNMHADDPAWYRLPEERELAAQYLLLYELSLSFGLDLNDRIAVDKSATRVTATLSEMPTSQIRDFLDRSRDWLDTQTRPGIDAEPTGPAVMFAYISQRNIESMLRGNSLAIVLIAAVMMLALRSVGLGALSLIPNALPILAAFGVWALTVRQVGMSAATVSATSLGIVVDDTVHFLAKYVRARREKGLDRGAAVRYAFETVGTAIVSTTVILAVGFSVLALSSFRINAQMGMLTVITIALALLMDLLLLPALLLIGHREPAPGSAKDYKTMKKHLRPHRALTMFVLAALAVAMTAGALAAPLQQQENANGAGAPGSIERRGWDVAARADRSDRGFHDSTVDLRMVLRNAAGHETTRTLRIATLEVPADDLGDRSLVVFETPGDIEGTALLSHARILDPDDQWLYLPALKRIKRISSVNKSGPFVGSEFAFEDFTALELHKYTYRWLRQEACGDLTCDVIERFPRYEHSGYTKQVSWVDTDVFQVRKVDFYDRRGDLLKSLALDDYRLYDDAYWRAHRLSMVNHQTAKETDLLYSDYRHGLGLREGDFERGALQRVR